MQNEIRIWQRSPTLRLLLALIAGIVLQWHIQLPLHLLLYLFVAALLLVLTYHFVAVRLRFQLAALNGLFMHLLVALAGGLLVWGKDVRHDAKWFGRYYHGTEALIVRLEEPLVEKANSYKALATVLSVSTHDNLQPATGTILIYFKKDSSPYHLRYGSIISLAKPLQPVQNAGNPGGFDYQRYSLFQGITHQAYLSADDFYTTGLEEKNSFKQFIFNCRSWVLSVLQRYIVGEKEIGLAEALLIGYKDDLDKNLVQSYTNTGVVHVIAISGLHLGLIYWLLLLLTKPLKRRRQSWWLRLLIILTGLWLFSILAGAQPSVIRSALMFSVIATGEAINKKASIINTLALSAFVLLCINPYWLWDVGFQLSYAAVLSIILFFQPVYNWLYFPNKAVDFIWKLNAVTIAAQVLTLPISIYHFHQFPLLFLLTNLVAVPLSSAILLGEIGLCLLSLVPPAAKLVGLVLSKLIFWMNSYVEQLDGVSFALWNGLSINLLQLFLLTSFALAFSYWWMERKKALLQASVVCLLFFFSLRSFSFIQRQQQQKLIVYNVPKHKAIDLISGRSCSFIGDRELMLDDFYRNFHIQPSRILHRIDSLNFSHRLLHHFSAGGKRLLLIDNAAQVPPLPESFDVVVLSKNPRVYLNKLAQQIRIRQLVIDGSVPQWKARLWKKDCAVLNIPCHDVTEKGAFVMNL
jgi:competence protein ComEC